MSRILGLDLGTNSVGWALIEENTQGGQILGLGSRIIPMSQDVVSGFEEGKPQEKNKTRRQQRSARRNLQRYKLRRERLVKALHTLGWIPDLTDSLQRHAFFGKNPVTGFPLEPIDLFELRDRALREEITLGELARILYQLNQHRGFKSNRKVKDSEEVVSEGHEETVAGSTVSYEHLSIVAEEVDSSGKKKTFIYTLEDGTQAVSRSRIPFTSEEKIELRVARKMTKKDGLSVQIQLADRSAWEYRKDFINRAIEESGFTVGQYYYQSLATDRHFRTKDNIVLRSHYIREFDRIWTAQVDFRRKRGAEHEIVSEDLSRRIAELLYPSNVERRNVVKRWHLKDVFRDDIIYYQRPLKSQRDLISDCRFEPDKKSIPKSHPLFQEFRIWDKLTNIRLTDSLGFDVTSTYINPEVLMQMRNHLSNVQSSKTASLLASAIPKAVLKSLEISEPELKGNITRAKIISVLGEDHPLNKESDLNPWDENNKLIKVWHLLYSLDQDSDILSGLMNPRNGFSLSDEQSQALLRLSFEEGYGSLSARAIRKLLPLMSVGANTSAGWAAHSVVCERLDQLCKGEIPDGLSPKIAELFQSKGFTSKEQICALPYYAAAAVVYGSHSELLVKKRYKLPEHVQLLPRNSLRNPIAEQIVNEAIQVVRDIWKKWDKPDEIRIELARSLKNSADKRKSIAKSQKDNRDLRELIRKRLVELNQPIKDEEKYSLWIDTFDPGQNELTPQEWAGYRSYLLRGSAGISSSDIERYRLWSEQNHVSVYTGRPIPLSRLFSNADYQVDHIIPKQRFYDDSLSNKVIVESNANKDKGTPGRNLTGMEYIKAGPVSKDIRLLDETAYRSLVNRLFRSKRAKLNNLLAEEIPNDFVNRQLKDTQYITLAVRKEMAKIVGPENIMVTTGSVTDHLREQWGIAHVFKELLLPRFERYDKLKEAAFQEQSVNWVYDQKRNKKLLRIAGYSKRLDHRHHAADALVIACTRPVYIKRLNDLNRIYQEQGQHGLPASSQLDLGKKAWQFPMPWSGFPEDAKRWLEGTAASVKNRNRLLTKSTNRYVRFNKDGKKEIANQIKGLVTSVRGELHNPQPLGETWVTEVRSLPDAISQMKKWVEKGNLDFDSLSKRLTSSRERDALRATWAESRQDWKELWKRLKKDGLSKDGKKFESFHLRFQRYTKRRKLASLTPNQVENIANPVLRREIQEHIDRFRDIKKALGTAEGLAAFNHNRKVPVIVVKTLEAANTEVGDTMGQRRMIRKGDNNKKLHTTSSDNHALVIHENLTDLSERNWPVSREYEVVSFRDAVSLDLERQPLHEVKSGFRSIVLKKNDPVLFLGKDVHVKAIDWGASNLVDSLYIVTKFSGSQFYFLPVNVADLIERKFEFGSQNCIELIDGNRIADYCIPVHMDRLGEIKPRLKYD
jgi:CRISPR-associated endonuclease Csn1